MTMAAASPRPWRVVPYGDGDSLVIHDARGDFRVCFMATPGSSPDALERIEANAELIVHSVNVMSRTVAVSRGDLDAEGTFSSLATTAGMIERWAPEALPADDNGKLSFARLMLDVAAAEIRAFLTAHPATD
jgi:hypothetical protein